MRFQTYATFAVRSTTVLLLTLVAGCTTSSPAPDDQPRGELLNRVTNAYPAFSPDGLWVAYMSTADGDFDIYAINPTLGIREQLTDAPERDGTPTWSPDGRKIAFQSFRDGHSQVYVMDRDGSNPVNLSHNRFHEEHPVWSPDGERILFASNRDVTPDAPDNIDLYSMRTDGSDVHRITHTPEVETYPSWSPDGSRITCRRIGADGNWEVMIMNADGSDARAISRHPGFDGWPVWSPDGRRIAFSSERAGSADLYLYDLETEAIQRLTWDDNADERQPWFSPDGETLVYARYVWFRDQPFYEASDIYVISVPGR